MIIQPPKTIEDFKKIRVSILELMNNPHTDSTMYNTLTMKLTKINDKIEDFNNLK